MIISQIAYISITMMGTGASPLRGLATVERIIDELKNKPMNYVVRHLTY